MINKFVTKPLWRLLEPGINILESIMQYQKTCSLFLDFYMLDNVHLLDNVIFFENSKTSINNIHSSLVFPSNILDELRKQCLQIIFRRLCFVTRKILDDHFKDCKYANPQVTNNTKRLSVQLQ